MNELLQMLRCFHACTGLNAYLADQEGQILLAAAEQPAFCTTIGSAVSDDTLCVQERRRIGRQAGILGDAYFHTCQAGLCIIAFPLFFQNTQYGTVIAGPFLLEEPDDSLIISLGRHLHISDAPLLRLARCAGELPVLAPVRATQISNLLGYLMSGFVSGARERMHAGKDRLLQQAKISDSIRHFKNLSEETRETYPVALENTLTARVKRGDTAGARTALNELFAFLMLYESYQTDKLKIRVIELCSLLSRAAMEHNPDFNSILTLNETLIKAISKSDDFNEICYILSDNIDIFTEQFLETDQHHQVITNAIGYLSAHYSEPVTLPSLAKTVGVHPTYLSSLFKQVTGYTFKNYLNQIRVERALQLLTGTDYPIMEIAIACGFNDQSYFTKVFKKHTGLTPKQFR